MSAPPTVALLNPTSISMSFTRKVHIEKNLYRGGGGIRLGGDNARGRSSCLLKHSKSLRRGRSGDDVEDYRVDDKQQ
jgi:hypothetical protein